MSANDLNNFWDQTISKWPFSGHFELCNIYLTQEMQNDWTMNIKQNVILCLTKGLHMTNFTLKNPSRPVIFLYFFKYIYIFYYYLGNLGHFELCNIT